MSFSPADQPMVHDTDHGVYDQARVIVDALQILKKFHASIKGGTSLAGLDMPLQVRDWKVMVDAANSIMRVFQPDDLLHYLASHLPITARTKAEDKQWVMGARTDEYGMDMEALKKDMIDIRHWLNMQVKLGEKDRRLTANDDVLRSACKLLNYLNPLARPEAKIVAVPPQPQRAHEMYKKIGEGLGTNQSKYNKKPPSHPYIVVDGYADRLSAKAKNLGFTGPQYKTITGQPTWFKDNTNALELFYETKECREDYAYIYGAPPEPFDRPLNESPVYQFHAIAWARRVYGREIQRLGFTVDPFYGRTIAHWLCGMYQGVPTYLLIMLNFICEIEAQDRSTRGVKLYCMFYDEDQPDGGGALIDGRKVIRKHYVAGYPSFPWAEEGQEGLTLTKLKRIFITELKRWRPDEITLDPAKDGEPWSATFEVWRQDFMPYLTDFMRAEAINFDHPTTTTPQLNGSAHQSFRSDPSDTSMSEVLNPLDDDEAAYKEIMGEAPPVVSFEPPAFLRNPPAVIEHDSAAPTPADNDYQDERKKTLEFINAFKAQKLTGDVLANELIIEEALEKMQKLYDKNDGAVVIKGLHMPSLLHKLEQLREENLADSDE